MFDRGDVSRSSALRRRAEKPHELGHASLKQFVVVVEIRENLFYEG